MLVNIHAAKCVGIRAIPVTIEVNITLGVGIHQGISIFFSVPTFSIIITY